jgi:hypothetical protein
MKAESALTNVNLWFEYQNLYFSLLKIGFQVPTITTNPETIKIEKIEQFSTPYYVEEFYNPQEELNKIQLPDMPINTYLGIWLKKEYVKSNIDNYYSNQNIFDRYKNDISSRIIEPILLKMTWD